MILTTVVLDNGQVIKKNGRSNIDVGDKRYAGHVREVLEQEVEWFNLGDEDFAYFMQRGENLLY